MHLARPTTPRIEPVPRVLERLRGQGHDAANLYATLATNKKVSNAMAGVFACFYGDDADFDDQDHELYDLQEDPHELVNLANDPGRRNDIRGRFETLKSLEATHF